MVQAIRLTASSDSGTGVDPDMIQAGSLAIPGRLTSDSVNDYITDYLRYVESFRKQ